MKKQILLYVLFLIGFISCTDNAKNKQLKEKHFQDSIKIETARIDSLQKIKIDSLEDYAFGDAKFGMTIKELKKTDAFKGGFFCEFFVSPPLENERFGSMLFNVRGQVFNDTLYRVNIESYYKTANYIDAELQVAVEILESKFSEKYGNPKISNPFPKIFDFKPGYAYVIYSWEIGDKKISITMDEKDSGSEYRTSCTISSEKYTQQFYRANEREYKKSKPKEQAKNLL